MSSRRFDEVDILTLSSWKDAPSRTTTAASTYDADDDLCDRIVIWRGDITRLDVDAVVNAANEKLEQGGGICGAIFAAAGPKLTAACSKLGGCPTGNTKVTPGFNLPSKYILHTVGPIYNRPKAELAKKQLASCYLTCLDQATVFNMRSVAFCCISTGIYGFPKEDAARVAFGTIRSW